MTKLVPIPDYGEKMLAQDWIDSINSGAYNEYDGSGYWATDSEMDDEADCFSPQPSWATHVVWFNK